MAATSYGPALDLVYEVAEVIKGIEHRASEAESELRSKLQLAQRRIEESETELQSERLHLEAAEREMCELEMRVRVADAKVRNIRTQWTRSRRRSVLNSLETESLQANSNCLRDARQLWRLRPVPALAKSTVSCRRFLAGRRDCGERRPPSWALPAKITLHWAIAL